ncbi:MAG: hypothetical protein KIT34_06350 [Cyanobacteria bacterium TGS_CYA1]|nr:hypothetical protein [Cyanobacteria bacterium TGS_CYA1]
MPRIQNLLLISICLSSFAQTQLFLSPAKGAEPDYLKAAMSEYYKGHFDLARAQLEEALKREPKNQIAHYFLAQTLCEMHNNKGALQEYELCFKLDPKSSCGIKAKEGIEQFKKFEQRGYQTVRQNRRDLAHDRLTSQIDRKVEESIESNKAISKKTMEDAQKEAERIKAQAEQDIKSLPRLRRNGYWRNQMTQQIREQSKERATSVMDRAKAQTEQMEKDTASKIESFQSLKEGIHQGLQQHKKGTNIAPEGTNAYVRNYEHKK